MIIQVNPGGYVLGSVLGVLRLLSVDGFDNFVGCDLGRFGEAPAAMALSRTEARTLLAWSRWACLASFALFPSSLSLLAWFALLCQPGTARRVR